MIQQTRDGWNIHHMQHPYAEETANIWQQEWGVRETQLQEIPKQNNVNYKTEHGKQVILTHMAEYLHGHETGTIARKKIIAIKGKNPDGIQLTSLDYKEQETTSRIMLKITQTQNTRLDTQETQYQCATCYKTYTTIKGRGMHQKKPTTRQRQITPIRTHSILRPNDNCREILPNQNN